jgi:hypothetical protein
MHDQVMPSLLAGVHQQKDQHEQQADTGCAERPKHQRSDEVPNPADRAPVVEAHQLQSHQPHARTGSAYRKTPPDEQHPGQDHDDRGNLNDESLRAADSGRKIEGGNTKKGRHEPVDQVREKPLGQATYFHAWWQTGAADRRSRLGGFHADLLGRAVEDPIVADEAARNIRPEERL